MSTIESDRAYVVCICGVLAAGKTTLTRRLSTALGGAAFALFDDYEQYGEWPSDIGQWMSQGCDPGEVRNPRLLTDIQSLRSGRSIQHPIDQHVIQPSPIVLLEDPFGRTRPEIRDWIDLALFVDLPWDLSVVRMVQRALRLEDLPEEDKLGDGAVVELYTRIRSARRWLTAYSARRDMYTTLAEPVRVSADRILDGTQSRETLEDTALGWIGDAARGKVAIGGKSQ